MRVLILSQFFTPDITAAAFRIADTACVLAKAGHQVAVVTTYPHKTETIGVDDCEWKNLGIQVIRCQVPVVTGSGGMKAYLRHYVTYMYKSIFRSLWLRMRWGKPDVVFATSPPLFVGISGRVLAGCWWRPFVFEVRDIWPDSAVAAGQISNGGRAYRFGRRLERYLYRKATAITCVSQPMKKYIEGESTTPVTVVYNGVPAAKIKSSEVHRDSDEDGSIQTILYAGNIGHVQELDLLAGTFLDLIEEGKIENWKLRVIGTGVKKDDLVRLVRSRNGGLHVSIEAPVQRDKAAQCMRNSDALFLNLRKDHTLEKTIPSKLFDYMLAARPILASLAGEGRSILESTGANLCCSPGDRVELRNMLLEGFKRHAELRQRADANKQVVAEHFTRERNIARLTSVLEEVTMARERKSSQEGS